MARTAAERSRDRRERNRGEDRWAATLKDLASRNASKLRSKGRAVQCTITIEEILELGRRQGMRCYFSGLEFHLAGGKRHARYPSLDRQDVNGDYSMSNCRLTAWAYNRGRGDMPTTEFLSLLQDTLYSFQSAPWCQEYHRLFLPVQPSPLDKPVT